MLHFDDDKLPHAKNDEHDWRESYYCNFFDQNSNLCGVFWQGVRPNAGHGEAVFLLCDGPTDLIRSVDMKVKVEADKPEERHRAGKSTFTCVEPWKHWIIRYEDGDDWFELDWKQMTDVCDWEWEDITNSKHFQLAGKVVGKGNVGGREISFTGYGERDRAWGARNYAPLKVSFWNVIQFPDDSAMHAFALQIPDGGYRLHGFLHKDGRTRPIVRFEADTVYQSPKGPPETGKLRYEDDEGRVVEIAEFKRKNHLGFGATHDDGGQLEEDQSKAQSLMFLTFQRFTRSDGLVGNGMIDYNCWVGLQPQHIVAEAKPVLYSTLYTYGRE